MANLAVTDLDHHVEAIRERGITPGDMITANKNVRLCAIADPDNNQLTLIDNFRENY